MSDWKTAAEWAAEGLDGVPATESGVIRTAKREDWNALGSTHARKRKGRGGGWEYHVSCLPEAARADWARRQRAALASATATREAAVVKERASETAEKVAAHRRRVMEARGAVMVELRRREILDGSARQAILNLLAEAQAGLLPTSLMEMLALSVEKGRGELRLPSRARLYAWRQAYQEGGVRALLPEARPQECKSGMPDWLPMLLRHYCKPAKPTLAQALDDLRKHLADPSAAPSYDQARRAIASLKGTDNYLAPFKRREGPIALKARMAFTRRTLDGIEPTEIYTSDGKLFEAEVAHPIHGRPFRPEITPILDVATRKCVGWSVGLVENSRGVADALRHACETHGIPALLYTDRGPGFRNDALDNATSGICGRLGITPVHSLPYVSQSRGVIERSHQSIWTNLAKALPSYCGDDMDREAGKARQKALVRDIREVGASRLLPTWDQFLAAVEATVAAYNDRPHRTLKVRDAESGRLRAASPNEKWAEFVASGFEAIAVTADEVDDLFRPYVRRKSARGEVQWNNNQYFHQALQPFDGMEVLVGIDIHDASRVWVRELVHHEGKPAQGALICVADYFANKQRYFPHSLTDKAKETRARGRMRRLDLKREEVEAEARGVYFIEAQALAPVAEFIEPARAPEAVAVIAPQPEAVSSGAPEPAHAFADDEEVCMAVAIMADHGTLNTMNPGWRITLEEKIHRPAGRRKLEMAGVDPWALLDLLRSAA
ncbi:Mu transposase C-terminal domain-containing protein [Paracoccus sanguinis]|uniref:Putative transposase n=1 Tax=Paracoccus sanguinis TaxID=1545044 RepID=A0A1H2SMQ1_9RHOB|nr:Mu transposase C-terminal domain-containing protein [Paracoccus sanguinis]SDW32797.1 putative transposase [Paracoccus sanguinis]